MPEIAYDLPAGLILTEAHRLQCLMDYISTSFEIDSIYSEAFRKECKVRI